MAKRRLDIVLAERGFFESREKAQRAVLAGRVRVGGEPADKPGTKTAADAPIEVLAPERYVGRGGYKLEAALDAFGVDPRERICLDAGASTGGFTDCLLQRGARLVHAVDVGHGQLAWKLREDARVHVREKFNLRHLQAGDLEPPPELAVIDVSFISLELVLPPVAAALCGLRREIVALVKPQFELSKRDVPRGGVVRDDALREQALERVRRVAGETPGCRWLGSIDSPLAGADGNREYLAWIACE